MKKIFLIFAGIMAALLCLSGCGISRVANEKQLQEMLVEKYPESVMRNVQEEEITFAVEKCEIVRRQTNKDDKKDMVDLKLSVYTNDYEGEFYYTLHLDYYDEGGWQLDTYNANAADVLKAKGNTVPEKLIEEEMAKLEAAYGKCELINENFDSETGILYHIYNVDCDTKYLKAKGDITVEYKLDTRDPSMFFRWCMDEKSGVTQEWTLDDRYELDLDRETASSDYYYWGFPAIIVEGDTDNGILEKIDRLYVRSITNDKIELEVSTVRCKYRNGYTDDDKLEYETLSFDLSTSEREIEFCRNHDTGEYLAIKLCPKRGFVLVNNGSDAFPFKPWQQEF